VSELVLITKKQPKSPPSLVQVKELLWMATGNEQIFDWYCNVYEFIVEKPKAPRHFVKKHDACEVNGFSL